MKSRCCSSLRTSSLPYQGPRYRSAKGMHSNSRIYSTLLAIYGVFFGGLATQKTRTSEHKSKEKTKKQLDHEHELAPPSFASGFATLLKATIAAAPPPITKGSRRADGAIHNLGWPLAPDASPATRVRPLRSIIKNY